MYLAAVERIGVPHELELDGSKASWSKLCPTPIIVTLLYAPAFATLDTSVSPPVVELKPTLIEHTGSFNLQITQTGGGYVGRLTKVSGNVICVPSRMSMKKHALQRRTVPYYEYVQFVTQPLVIDYPVFIQHPDCNAIQVIKVYFDGVESVGELHMARDEGKK
jgi:hypothetical protein